MIEGLKELAVLAGGGAAIAFCLTLGVMLGAYAIRGIFRELVRPKGQGDAWLE